MTKITGQKLKDDFNGTATKLANLENKINKKFELIVEEYRNHMSKHHIDYLIYTSIQEMDIEQKLGIIIQTEANYVEATGNQLDIFK